MLALFPQAQTAVATVVSAGHGLPVPGNPAYTDRLARNIVHSALGEPVPDAPSLTSLYPVFDLVSLVLVALAALGLTRALWAWRRGLQPRHPALAAGVSPSPSASAFSGRRANSLLEGVESWTPPASPKEGCP